MTIQSLGRWLLVAGLVLTLAGAAMSFLPRLPWVGRLPGDIYIKRDHFSFYFPLTTCLLLSIVISLLVRLFKR